MNNTDIQWHPGFVAAMELELIDYRGKLEFLREYNLNTKPLQIDLLVIKKEQSVEIANEMGKIFKRHNIIEYKSPDDSLNIDTFYKVQSYAGLYKAAGKTVDERKDEDITVSIIRERKPVELFKVLKSKNVKITMPYKGIYHIDGIVMFTTQIIATRELSAKGHTWIKSLSDKMKMPDMKRLLDETARLKGDYERELADSVLEVALRANKVLAESLKGEADMSETLLELVKPLIQDQVQDQVQNQIQIQKQIWIQKGEQKGRQEGQILGAVNALRSLNHSDEEIKSVIMKNYNLSEEAAEKYL